MPIANHFEIDDVRSHLSGREGNILAAIGIEPPHRGHIRCPSPSHEDRHPSFRWDHDQNRFFCSCGSGDIFDLVQTVRGGNLDDAIGFIASVIGIDDAPTAIAQSWNNGSPVREQPPKKRWSRYAEEQWRSCMPLSGDALD